MALSSSYLGRRERGEPGQLMQIMGRGSLKSNWPTTRSCNRWPKLTTWSILFRSQVGRPPIL